MELGGAMCRRSTVAVLFPLILASAAPLLGQEGTDATRIRVFLDCQTFGCDFDLTRREIPWVAWVRNRQDADVHVLVASTQAGSGTAYDIRFIGLAGFLGDDHSLSHSVSSTDTSDERRRGLIEKFELGLVSYVGATPAADFLRIQYRGPEGEGGDGEDRATPENDPWNLWVFTVSVGGSARGQSRTSSASGNGSLTANRTSADWKFEWGARLRYSEDQFELEDSSTVTSIRRNSGTDILLVKSMGDHWGIGGRASVLANTFNNTDIRAGIQPTVEYNVFPYSESSRRQFTLQYHVGAERVRYDEETIFEVTQETIFQESLTAGLSLRQPWGSVSTSLSGSHFLEDVKKNRVSLFANTNIRIVRGLSLNFFGNISRVRDQVFLARSDASDEDVLLRRRALETNFNYFMNFSIRFTFGSIFNDIVNPRFGNAGREFFFF
jgi:hypothetical protein